MDNAHSNTATHHATARGRWMALVAGELVAAPSGLGFMINNARTVFRSDYILLGMVLIGVLGLVLDFLMRKAALLVMPWHRGQ